MEYSSTEQSIGWFRDRYVEGTLIIKPPYQRKPVWKARQKCYLIESILMGYPIPEIYIQQSVDADEKTQYAIVDGQQRIRAVLQYIGSETDEHETEHNGYALDMLNSDSPWSNKRFEKLTADQKKKFVGHRLAVRHLDTDNEDEIREMFRRLNKFLTPLKPQELRNSTYTGPFVQLASKLAEDEYWAENRIVSPASIRRMGDIEFVSELVIGLIHGPQGGNSATIDEYYGEFEDYEDEFPGQKSVSRLFSETRETVNLLLPSIKDTRWSNKTDFYSLFVGLGELLKSKKLIIQKTLVGRALLTFASNVDKKLADKNANVSNAVSNYVNAVEKGANEKSRRAARHEAIQSVLHKFFIDR
jgi:hypothetical protein